MKYLDSVYPTFLKVLSIIILVLAPVRSTMIAVGVLIFLDMLTGVWASRKNGEPITSSGFKKTVAKMFLYQCSVIVGFLMEHYLLDGVPVVKVIGGIIALTEGKSFFENVNRITGTDFWVEAINKIQTSTVKQTPEPVDEEEVKSRIDQLQKVKPKKKGKRKKKK